MKIKKILAAVAAAAVAASMVAVNAFASEPVVKSKAGYKPIELLSAGNALPDEFYGAGVEVTFNISTGSGFGEWLNGTAGIMVNGESFAEKKFGGKACDADGNRSWFPAGSVVIADNQKTAVVVVNADMTGKSGANLFICSGDPEAAEDNKAFNLDSIAIKNAAGFEATYADGKLTVTSSGNADAASTPADDDSADAASTPADDDSADADFTPADDDSSDDADSTSADEDSSDEDSSDDADSAPADDGNADADSDSTPAADGDTASKKTGNVPAAAMVSVMALAGAAAVVSKKRK